MKQNIEKPKKEITNRLKKTTNQYCENCVAPNECFANERCLEFEPDKYRNEDMSFNLLNNRLDFIFEDLNKILRWPIKDKIQCQVINELYDRILKYKRTRQ